MADLQDYLGMIETVADTAQEIMVESVGQLEWDAFQRRVLERLPGVTRSDLLAIMQFLKRLAPAVFAQETSFKIYDLSKLNPMGELSYQYSMARHLLDKVKEGGVMDPKEAITCLKETTRILEATVRLQDKVRGVAELEEFEQAVYAVLDEADPTLRTEILNRLERMDTGSRAGMGAH